MAFEDPLRSLKYSDSSASFSDALRQVPDTQINSRSYLGASNKSVVKRETPNKKGAENDEWTMLNPGYVVHLNERLLIATERGNYEEVLKLLEEGADPSWADSDDHKRTSLMHAARCGHLDIATLLLQRGAKINSADQSGWTALHCAAYYGQPLIVKLLLEKGADYKLKHKGGMTAQDTAEWNEKHECTRLLVKPEKLVAEYKAKVAKENEESRKMQAQQAKDKLFNPISVPAATRIKQTKVYRPPNESESKMAKDEVELMDPEQWSAASVSFWFRHSFKELFEPRVLEAYTAGIREQDVDGPALLNPEIFNDDFLVNDVGIKLKAHRFKILLEAKKLREHEDEDLSAFFAKIGLLGKGLEELCEKEGIDEPSYFSDFTEDQLVEAGFKRAHAKRVLKYAKNDAAERN
eukprot:gb/GEZN01004865.1/.p1 GENE.gb/GEZN01004865.1/~~gb/GEZN01004865.1/.p1  ORF type:complete len:408 (+),score=68.58 gb/GEZN01004865.1/:29-1252(+)